MKILLISNDRLLHQNLSRLEDILMAPVELFDKTKDPLDLMAAICLRNPLVLIMDDDFVKPESGRLLASIRRVKSSISIIFLTSDTSIELGKTITSQNIQFYAIKPIQPKELVESINGVLRHKLSKSTH